MNLAARWRQRSSVVGIAIAPDAVRLLQFARIGTGLQVSHYACEALPSGTGMADHRAVGAAIARVRRHSGTRARHAVVALGAASVMLRLLSVPAALNDTALETRMELEAVRHLPASGAALPLDFAVLDEEVRGSGQVPPDHRQILLAIADPAAVRRCARALKQGGFRVAAIDVEMLALARALAILGGQCLSPEQLLQPPAALPPLADPLAGCTLASGVPAQALAADASALALVCGLALRGVST